MYINPIKVRLSDHFSVIEAVEVDREQYEKGWNDRDNKIVRCKDCKYWENEHCRSWEYNHSDADDYCSLGERKENANE